MYKSNYVEFNKVYNFKKNIEDNYLFLSNVKHQKKTSYKKSGNINGFHFFFLDNNFYYVIII